VSVLDSSKDAVCTNCPQHVAVIMDGNGRWARQRFMPRIEGHRKGAKTVRMMVEECRRLGIRYLTLFAFSTENWRRPRAEVDALMRLLHFHLVGELEELHLNGVRIRVIGELDNLPARIKKSVAHAEEFTCGNTELDLILAISYGGRQEITEAVKKIALQVQQGTLSLKEITESTVGNHLYLPDVPDPDLLIRTSNESRISNFLLWQLAYAEIVITPVHWPQFSREDFHICLKTYGTRSRRFGLTAEQLENSNGANETTAPGMLTVA
jgi:undecaprenyl diphosphate synthase